MASGIELLGCDFASVVDGDIFWLVSALFELLKQAGNITFPERDSSARSKGFVGVGIN